jgi:hypothetical protein
LQAPSLVASSPESSTSHFFSGNPLSLASSSFSNPTSSRCSSLPFHFVSIDLTPRQEEWRKNKVSRESQAKNTKGELTTRRSHTPPCGKVRLPRFGASFCLNASTVWCGELSNQQLHGYACGHHHPSSPNCHYQ